MTLYSANQGLKFTIKSHFWWDFLFSPFHLKSIPLKSSAKNEAKQKKLETRISALEDQLLEKNIIFQGLTEDEFEDHQETKTKIISVLATVTEGATAEDRKESAKKTPIDSIECMGKYKPNRSRPMKVKFTNKTDVSCLFKNRKKLPDGVFIDREYSKVTEKEHRILRPIVKAAWKIEEYKGKFWLEGPYLKLDGKRYHRQNVHTLPAKLGPAEVTSVSDENCSILRWAKSIQ